MSGLPHRRPPDSAVRAWWLTVVLLWSTVLVVCGLQVIRNRNLLSERAPRRITEIHIRTVGQDFTMRKDESARWIMETPRGSAPLRQDLASRVMDALAAARRVPAPAVPDQVSPATLEFNAGTLRLSLTDSSFVRRGAFGTFRLPPGLRVSELSDASWWLDSAVAAPLQSSRDLAGLVLRLDGASAGAIRSGIGGWVSDTGDREIPGLEERVRDLLADLGQPLPFAPNPQGPELANLRLLPTHGTPVELLLRLDVQGQLLLERSSDNGALLLAMDTVFLGILDEIASLLLDEEPVGWLHLGPDQPASPLLPRFR